MNRKTLKDRLTQLVGMAMLDTDVTAPRYCEPEENQAAGVAQRLVLLDYRLNQPSFSILTLVTMTHSSHTNIQHIWTIISDWSEEID